MAPFIHSCGGAVTRQIRLTVKAFLTYRELVSVACVGERDYETIEGEF